MSEAAIAASANPAQVVQLARAALHAVTTAQTTTSARATRRRIVTAFQTGYGQRLTIDGGYGPRTAAAISLILDIPLEELPGYANDGDAPAPSRTRPATAPPARLTTAVRLSSWTEEAVANDATAARILSALNANASLRAIRTSATDVSGDELGQVPEPLPPPTDAERELARRIWMRARDAGGRALRETEARAASAVTAGDRALRAVRLELDAAADTAMRRTLERIESGLTAILRPLATTAATAVRPLAGPALLIGLGLLLFMVGSRK